MGVISTQGFAFRLIANNDTQLDLFDDEEIFISDNVTGLFDLGTLPADFTRQITVPGTKKNNAFFEHVYDISIQSPYLFATNAKVPCYFDFGSFYLADGYMQLNKVNVIANKFIDSYEISIYGGLSSFARDINRYFLTDLTASLSQFNHTASFNNISASWNGQLFSGSIVYPFAEYGQKIQFTPEEAFFGIDSNEGALCVQDFKPSIRIKEVWDAIFETYGYTYSGSFWQQPWLDNVYMICNNKLRYPVFDNIDLETYGLFKIAPVSGSGQTNVTMSAATELQFPWFNIQSNPQENISPNLIYTLDVPSRLRGDLALNFEVKSTGTGNGMPAFYLHVRDAVSNVLVSTTVLVNYNRYMSEIQTYNAGQTRTQQFQLVTEFNTAQLPIGTYKFYLEYINTVATNFQVVLNSGNNLSNTYLEIKKVNQGGDNLVMDIAANMPFGTTGIKQVDFITGIQKKFNLVIYPNKVKPREFIVEEFNSWYTQGQIKDFNRYINLDKKIEFIPANNLAVNKLNFGDTLDGDYVSQQFSKANNREYGKSYYVDTENFFSQGTFEVKTTFASSPLIYLEGTGLSGSVGTNEAGFRARSEATATTRVVGTTSSIRHFTTTVVSTNTTALAGEGTKFDCDPINCIGTELYVVNAGDVLVFSSGGTDSVAWQFSKTTDAGTTVLDSGTAPGGATYNYIITAADISSTYLEFIAEAQGTE